jgi:hypothetical protein
MQVFPPPDDTEASVQDPKRYLDCSDLHWSDLDLIDDAQAEQYSGYNSSE